jgi:transcriptional antiterminator RfaH
MNWFCYVSRPRAERDAGAAIAALGYQVYVPLEKRIVGRPKAKARVVERALFPRYGFVQFDPYSDPWGEIIDADGVVDILHNGDNPSAVPDAAIEHLMLATDMGLFDFTKPKQNSIMKAGARVRITDGPFAGFVARVIQARAADRIKVLLRWLGAEREMTVPLSALREA